MIALGHLPKSSEQKGEIILSLLTVSLSSSETTKRKGVALILDDVCPSLTTAHSTVAALKKIINRFLTVRKQVTFS
jgi:hypothetical protein